MAKLLLPTVSSLAFLPTVSIAAKRRFHMEAMVYLFTTFFLVVSLGIWGEDPPHPAQSTFPGTEDGGYLFTTFPCWVMKKSDGELVKERAQERGLGDAFTSLDLFSHLGLEALWGWCE